MKSKLSIVATLVAGGFMITSCGVKSSPQSPDGSTYPAQYPAPLPPLEKTEQAPGTSGSSSPVVSDPKNFWQYPNIPPAQ